MFRFKRFTIEQDACPMKVGTDGVLLGAWVALGAADRLLLDVGHGHGVIALMLAQRSPAAGVTALDIDAACAEQARANADRSPWGGRVTTCCAPVPGVPAGGAVRSGGLQSALLRPFAAAARRGAHHGTPYRRAHARRADRRRLPAACARGASGRSSCRRSRHSGSASRRAAGWRCGG